MRLTYRLLCSGVAAAVLAACSGGATAPPVSQELQSSTRASGNVNAPFSYSTHPKIKRVSADFAIHNCPQGTSGCALSPATVNTAYNLTVVNGVSDGTGQNIVIVVAYGSPTIATDIVKFGQQFGLPAPKLTVVNPGGTTVNLSNANQLGWAEETTLDVEWAYATAPKATITLLVANNDQGQTLQSTLLAAATNYPGAALSLSFGTPEASINGGANNTQLVAAENVYRTAKNNRITVIASAGDLGATNGFATANPQYPASDPNVLGVGGTNLTLFNNGRYRSEAAWNDDANGVACTQPCGATGGAPSIIFPGRNVADVAFAANDSAVDIYIGFSAPALGVSPGWYGVGGTSVGPPVYAGIVAIANQKRAANGAAPLGFINSCLFNNYGAAQASKSPAFHDVTNGNNAFPVGAVGENAGPNYDNPTGLGTPNTNNLLTLLVTKC